MGSIVITRPKAAIKAAVASLATDPSVPPCEADMATELCETGCTHTQKAWLLHLIGEYGFEPVAA